MNLKEAAVIGIPIGHSLSPGIFSFMSHRLDYRNFTYNALEISSENLPDFVQKVRSDPRWVGLNVTIPHKETILKWIDRLTPEAHGIGAVNVVQNLEGQLVGHNTDVHGVSKTLDQHSCIIQGKRAFVYGAGGAARAVTYVLGQKQARKVDILNAHPNRAQALAKHMTKLFPTTHFRALSSLVSPEKSFGDTIEDSEPIELLVNTTPLGMSEKLTTYDHLPVSDYFTQIYKTSKLSFSKSASALDLIYRPEKTPFLISAANHGLNPIGGLNMLIEQALQTWRIWFGTSDALDQLKPDLSEYLRFRPIFLTGLMGVGKSTVGPILAAKLGWRFLDIDQLIVKETQMTIPEIFQKNGETYFREIENRIVLQHAFSPRTVVALGGGALNHSATRHLLKNTGQLAFLSARPETLLLRLENSVNERPLLASLNPEERKRRLTELLNEREKFYNLARFKIQTDHLSPENVVQKILEYL